MKRISILLVLLAFGVAACGEQAASQTDAAAVTPSATVQQTEAPTPSPEASDEPDASADAGDGTPLADLVPDELNGVPRTDIPGMDQIIAGALAQQGMDAEDAEFVFASYGDDADAVVLTAFRVPGINEAGMEQLARMMSGAAGGQAGVDAESVEIGGKSVLRMTAQAAAGGDEGVIYMYIAEGAAFTIISPTGDESAAEQLLAELP
jgi:hypothetical protein